MRILSCLFYQLAKDERGDDDEGGVADEEEEEGSRRMNPDPPRVRRSVASLSKQILRGNMPPKSKASVQNNDPDLHDPVFIFSLRELSVATDNFSQDCFLGQGGFGSVYKGHLANRQVVAVKKLDLNGRQGNREFLVEVLMLSLLHHPNLVSLIGYCVDHDQRLLVYEYMALGSLEDHLHDLSPHREPLDWTTRMMIALGAAEGLEYLHEKANPPVIFRDFKPSNILLSDGFFPKLSDFGLAKLGPVGDKTHVTTRIMGTEGYCAPEYAKTGKLTLMSDIYSFGVVFLELITGRRAIDRRRPPEEQDLVSWARPLFKDQRKFPKMADPLLQGRFPRRGLFQALAIAAMCLQEKAHNRPPIREVVAALSYLASQPTGSYGAVADAAHAGPSTFVPDYNYRNQSTSSVKPPNMTEADPFSLARATKSRPGRIAPSGVNGHHDVVESAVWAEAWQRKDIGGNRY